MDLGLEKKKALVTASTAGIGFAIAEALAREGATVYVNGRSKERVNAAIDRLRQKGVKAELHGLIADFSQKAAYEDVLEKVSSVDILVNNLGLYDVKPFEEITDEDWLRFYEVNVLSGIRLSRLYLPGMKAKNWGRIIFISSESALQIPAEMIHYGMTKTAQLSVARGLAESLTGTGITVNAVLPGPTRTEGVQEYIASMAKAQNVSEKKVEEGFFKEVRPSSIIKRFVSPEEVAAMVTFVCSEVASAVTGTSLKVDGGVVRSIA